LGVSRKVQALRKATAAVLISLQLLVLALFLPWLSYAAGGFLSTASATPIRLLDFLHIYWTVLTVGIPVDVAQFNWLTLPALAIHRRRGHSGPSRGHPPLATGHSPRSCSAANRTAIAGHPVYFISLPRQNL
jgi:hypothetical protein